MCSMGALFARRAHSGKIEGAELACDRGREASIQTRRARCIRAIGCGREHLFDGGRRALAFGGEILSRVIVAVGLSIALSMGAPSASYADDAAPAAAGARAPRTPNRPPQKTLRSRSMISSSCSRR